MHGDYLEKVLVQGPTTRWGLMMLDPFRWPSPSAQLHYKEAGTENYNRRNMQAWPPFLEESQHHPLDWVPNNPDIHGCLLATLPNLPYSQILNLPDHPCPIWVLSGSQTKVTAVTSWKVRGKRFIGS